MWFPRLAGDQLRQLVRTRPVVVVTGARQTGKTSLLRELFPEHRWVSLDLPSDAELAAKAPADFFRLYPPPVVIDEVQYAPSLFRWIKVEVDKDRGQNGRFLVTGSQRFPLMQEVTESLAGRTGIFELEPLSREEIAAAGTAPPNADLLLRGGYPELHAQPEIDAFQFYRSYIATYLERDVRTLANVTSLRDFERFLRACALRSGQLLNKAELARDVGISPPTANHWLSVLQASGQAVLLEPWFNNRTKSIVKSPKLYLTDTGILCALLNIRTPADLSRSPLIGAIWETAVFAELRKRESFRHGSWSINFWNDRRREVDFLIDRGGRFDLLDAKWAEHPDESDTGSLTYVAEVLGTKTIDRRELVTTAPHAYPIGREARAVTLADL